MMVRLRRRPGFVCKTCRYHRRKCTHSGSPRLTRNGLAQCDGEGGQAADEQAASPVQVPGRAGQSQVGEPRQQAADGDLPLQPGQRGAQAGVDALAEGGVPVRPAGDVDRVRAGEPVRVVVGRVLGEQLLAEGGKQILETVYGVEADPSLRT